MNVASAALAMTSTLAVRSPAMMSGSASGNSTAPQHLQGVHPHAVGGLADRRIDFTKAKVGVDQDWRAGEHGQRQQRRSEARTEERIGEKEDSDARYGACDPKGVQRVERDDTAA